MSEPPKLIDREALEKRRGRARRNPALFLHELVADEITERLSEVNRRFTNPAIVTAFPEVWHGRLQGARILPDDDVLGLQTESFDLVIHCLALHLANDPVGQLIQSRRAMTEDGLFMGALFAGQTLAELRISVTEAEIEMFGGLSPRIVPMADIRDLGGLMQRAGFALPVADSQTLTVTYPALDGLMRDLRGMGETNSLSQRRRNYLGKDFRAALERLYSQHFTDNDGTLRATFEIVHLAGWAPSDSQQKPLRPGSAKTRLANALGTTEFGSDGTKRNTVSGSDD